MWEINLADQLTSFLMSVVLGCILCFLYDVLRAARKNGFDSFWAVFLTDVLFWVLSAFITFVFLISRTNGELRGYVFVGELCGFLLCRVTFSRLFFFLLCLFLKKIVQVKDFFEKYTAAFYRIFDAVLFKISTSITLFLKRGVKTAKKLLKNSGKLLYTDNNNVSLENVVNESKTDEKASTTKT